MTPFVLISYFKIAEEQGEWAATKAVEILDGLDVSKIPIEQNKKVDINLNFNIAEKLGIKFSEELIRISTKSKANELYSHKKIARKNYSGIVLNILTHEPPVMGEATTNHASEFEELTGAKINITYASFGQLYQEALLGLKNSKYDIIFFGSLWLADFHKYLEPVPHNLLNSTTFKDIIPHYKKKAKWGDVTYQVTIDGDRHYLQYRKDILENPIYIKKFKKKYGFDLTIPKTWKELNRVAKFFNKMKIKSGKTIYGISEVTNKNEPLFSQFIKRAAPYAKHPDIRGGFYFDLKTMKPLINTPGFVEALKDFVDSQELYPPGGKSFG